MFEVKSNYMALKSTTWALESDYLCSNLGYALLSLHDFEYLLNPFVLQFPHL